tara:strand:- start:49 stop:393 length:345 start_codon:yes stop_codon:yes gene_type:complete
MKNINIKFSNLKELNTYIVSENDGEHIELTEVRESSIPEANHTINSLLEQVNSGIKALMEKEVTINPYVVQNLVYFPEMYTLPSDELIDNYLQNPNMFMGNKIYNFDYKPFYNV